MSGSSSDQSLAVLVHEGVGDLSGLSLLEIGNDGLLESKLDEIEREVPDNVPNPNDTDPSTRDTSDVGEAPVSEGGDDGRDELSETESTHEGERWSLSPGRTVRSGDEDKSLGDDGDLEVDDHVSSVIVDIVDTLSGDRVDTELVLEEVSVSHDGEQGDGGSGKVETVTDTVGEDLSQVPGIGGGGGQDSVEGEGHDSTVVEDRNDKDHE